eukprot:254084-Rhodomonas_salina.1
MAIDAHESPTQAVEMSPQVLAVKDIGRGEKFQTIMEGVFKIRALMNINMQMQPLQVPHNRPIRPEHSPAGQDLFDDDEQSEEEPLPEKVFTCAICLESSEDFDADWYECDTCTAQCCTTCLTKYLQVKTGESKPLCCPDPSCDGQIPEDVAGQLVGAERLDKHKKHIRMKEDPDLRECPHCGVLNSGSADDPDMVCSSCSGAFCFLHDVQHAGKACSKRAKAGCGLRSSMYISMHSTKCPGCKTPIQRSDGCPHMTCTLCKTEFCYFCGKATPPGMVGSDHRRAWRFQCNSAMMWKRRAKDVGIGAGVAVAAPVAAGLVVAAAGLAIGASPVLVPAVLIRKRRKRRAREKAREEVNAAWRAAAEQRRRRRLS